MKRIITILAITAVLSACVNNQVTTDAEVRSAAEFDKFQTWRWHAWEQDGSVNEIIQDQIKTKIEGEMINKGMALKESGPVDFFVHYIVNIRDDLEVDKLPTYEGFSERYIGIDRYGQHINVVEFQIRKQLDEERMVTKVVKGTLIIDVLDPENKKILMRMIAEKPIPSREVKPSVRQRRVDSIVEDLLSNFPPENVE